MPKSRLIATQMSNSTDSFGIALTGASLAQAIIFNDVMQDYLDYRLSTFPKLKALCAAAPEFAMAHLLKGYLLLAMGTRDTIDATRVIAAHVNTLEAGLTAREKLHLKALNAWARGDNANAVAHWDSLLLLQPTDILALKLQHFALFWLGQPDYMRDVCARVLPAWEQSTAAYGYVLGMYAFGLEETAEYAGAEKLGRQAIAINQNDLWAIHAVAHVLEMQGRADEGSALLNYPLAQWHDRNPFRGHLWWHAALFAVEQGDFDHALSIYDGGVRSDESTFYLDVQNTVSILARLEFAGVDVADRWNELADVAEQRQGDHVLLFTEPHNTMALARTGRFAQVDQQLTSLQRFALTPENTLTDLLKSLVLPVCEAIRDFYKGEYSAAVDKLMPLRYQYQPMGGSHAQRDIFAIYLLDAAARAGNVALEKALLTERIARRPDSFATQARYRAAVA